MPTCMYFPQAQFSNQHNMINTLCHLNLTFELRVQLTCPEFYSHKLQTDKDYDGGAMQPIQKASRAEVMTK